MNRVRIQRVLAALTLAGSMSTGSFAQQIQQWATIDRGNWSGIERPKQVVIQDEAAWKALWAEHARGGEAEPAVDFSKETVVAVFLGTRQTSKPVDLEISRKGGEVVVVCKESEGRTFSMPVVSQPFEIVKFPKASVVRIQGNGAKASVETRVAAAPETGLRDSVAKVASRVSDPFGLASAQTLAFDGGGVIQASSLVGGGEFAAPKASLLQLPPPPGQQEPQEPRQGRQGQGLPPPPGQQPPQGRQGGGLPPPPGQGGQQGGDNQSGGNLPPPPQYHPRPSDSRNLPPPPGSNFPTSDTAIGSIGYWHIYRDALGYPEERFGAWQSEDVANTVVRGGAETGVTQGTRYTADLDSRDYRNRYVLYWRWVGYDCDPQDNDRCARWDKEWKWYFEDTKYSRPRHMQVVVSFDRDQPLLPWEKESMRVHYDGSRVWVEYSDPSFRYSERGPIVDQQTGVASITLTPTARILRSPESAKVTAYLIKENGKLKLVVEDSRTREYAGETLGISYEIKKYVKWSLRHPFTFDQKVAERTQNGPERIMVDAASGKHVYDLGLSETGAEFYLDSWSFRRENSKLSSGEWIYRGKGNRVQM